MRDLDGMSAWMLEESEEERGHGKEILEFCMKSHFPVTLEQLPAPSTHHWTAPDQVWEDILKLEENNTQNLLKIAEAAHDCKQYGVMSFLDPFHIGEYLLVICHVRSVLSWLMREEFVLLMCIAYLCAYFVALFLMCWSILLHFKFRSC